MKNIPFEPDWEPIVEKHVLKLYKSLKGPRNKQLTRTEHELISIERQMKRLVNEITEHWY